MENVLVIKIVKVSIEANDYILSFECAALHSSEIYAASQMHMCLKYLFSTPLSFLMTKGTKMLGLDGCRNNLGEERRLSSPEPLLTLFIRHQV